MSLDKTIASMVDRIRADESCQQEVAKLQGEVLQVKVDGGIDCRLAFRNDTVELDEAAAPTFHIMGQASVFNSLFKKQLTPIAAIMTRRLKVTFDPVRLPLFKRVLAVGFTVPSSEET